MHLRVEDPARIKVVVGMGTHGIAAGARPVADALFEEIMAKKLYDKAVVTVSGNIEETNHDPVVEVHEPGKDVVTYINMTPDKAVEIVNTHIIGGQIVEKYIG
jgi:NADP-reducing hydrogenase subunit HndB